MTSTIPQLIRASADRFASRIAIEEGEVEITFADLLVRAERAARALIATGFQRGDRAAIWAPNIHEWIEAALGIHFAGGVLVPINTRFKGAEAAFVLERSGACVLFTVQGFLGNDYLDLLDGQSGLQALHTRVVLRGDVPPGSKSWAGHLDGATAVDIIDVDVDPDDLSDILFTSGTTGMPKGVMTTHEQNLRAFRSWTEVIGLREGDRYLIVNPFFHAFGYKAGWLSAIMRGATILPQAVFDAEACLRRIGVDRVSMLPGPPALYQTILGHPKLAEYDLSSLRLAVTGAAVIPVELIERMRSELGFETVVTGYGLTEACGIATMCRHDDDAQTVATTSGRAIDDVEVRIVSDEHAEVPRGEPGEIVVRGYNVMKGYLDDEAATGSTIDEQGWLHTGDIGVMDDRGYIRITDRKKDMFIMGGFNCYPAEIERLMLANPDYVQVAIIGVPDDRMGEVGKAYVVPRSGADVSPDAVQAWCKANIANYKVPRFVEIVESLPMNATGKVQKFVLRDQHAAI